MAEKKTVSDKPMRVRRPLRSMLKVSGIAVDTASSLVSTVLRLVGTILLILLITGLLFSCIFAYYVKTCLTPELDITLEDYQLSEASTIWYQDLAGQWQEGVTIGGDQRRIWVEYEDIPKYMEQALIAIED